MPKVVTLTLNPGIDRTLYVRSLVPRALNRVIVSRADPGGKGINVATALSRLGIEAVAVFPIGGEAGRWIRERVLTRGVKVRSVEIAGETRTNIKVVESEARGLSTELNEPGPAISPLEASRIVAEFLDEAKDASFAVLSGSVPPGISEDIYHDLILELSRMGVRAVLDASGALLRKGVLAGPYIIKPNREEAEELLTRPIEVPGGLGAALCGLLGMVSSRGLVAISLGPEGAAFGSGRKALWVRSNRKEAVNPTGCGDAMVAGIVAGLIRGLEFEDVARFAVACATAAAFKDGTEFPCEDEVQEVLGSVSSMTELFDTGCN